MYRSSTPLQRIGRVVPRMREVAPFVANVPGLSLLLFCDDSNSNFSSRHNELFQPILTWIDSLSKETIPPRNAPVQPDMPRHEGGMPFIYIATFGERHLESSNPILRTWLSPRHHISINNYCEWLSVNFQLRRVARFTYAYPAKCSWGNFWGNSKLNLFSHFKYAIGSHIKSDYVSIWKL